MSRAPCGRRSSKTSCLACDSGIKHTARTGCYFTLAVVSSGRRCNSAGVRTHFVPHEADYITVRFGRLDEFAVKSFHCSGLYQLVSDPPRFAIPMRFVLCSAPEDGYFQRSKGAKTFRNLRALHIPQMLPTPITSQLAGLLPFESGHGAHLSEYRM
jgi:hypothetical protein